MLAQTKIPKSLVECMETDPRAAKLEEWSEKIDQYGMILTLLIAIGGFIIAIVSGMTVVEYSGVWGLPETRTEFSFASFFITLVPWFVYTLICFCFYKVIVVSLKAGASVTQNQKVAASIALYTANKEVDKKVDSENVKVDLPPLD